VRATSHTPRLPNIRVGEPSDQIRILDATLMAPHPQDRAVSPAPARWSTSSSPGDTRCTADNIPSPQGYLLMRLATTLTDAATIATTNANDNNACGSTIRRILEEVTSVSDTWNVALTVTATYAKST
jgi:hypothetical protein